MRAAVYLCRTLAGMQAQPCIEDQRRRARVHAGALGHVVVAEYVDDGAAPGLSARAGLRRLLEDAQRARFGVVVISTPDRLSPEPRDQDAVLRWLAQTGVVVAFAATSDGTGRGCCRTASPTKRPRSGVATVLRTVAFLHRRRRG